MTRNPTATVVSSNGRRLTPRSLEAYHACTDLDFLRPDVRHNAVQVLLTFNNGRRLVATKTVFDMIEEQREQVARLHAWTPPDFAWMLSRHDAAKAALTASGIDLVPCINDAPARRFMLGPRDAIVLNDFEDASNNERAYELALWFGEMFFDPKVEREMIQVYYGRWTRAIDARIRVLRALADLKSATWAMVQESVFTMHDFDFRRYGAWKYMRARSEFQHPDWSERLRHL